MSRMQVWAALVPSEAARGIPGASQLPPAAAHPRHGTRWLAEALPHALPRPALLPIPTRTPVIMHRGPALLQPDLILTANYICSDPVSK